MKLVSRIAVALIALLHGYILVLEMFLWQTEHVMGAFGTTPGFAAQSAALAANQGLYNGFLAAGLIWGLVHRRAELAWQIQTFFLVCIMVAGAYAAMAILSILFIQTVPATIALILVLLTRSRGSASQ